MPKPILVDPLTRFWRFIAAGDGCWLWQGARTEKGYGLFSFHGRNRRAHRVAYALTHGLDVDVLSVVRHTCDNPPCVRLDHLVEGSASENQQDSVVKGRHGETKKTACPQGHEYSVSNTYRWRSRRHCRTCHRKHNREWAQQKRAAA